jgi:CHAT domain-containing protein/Tfp pilus assembly protein PilF
MVAGLIVVCAAALVCGQSAVSQPSTAPDASQPSDPPYKRMLTGADKEQVEELEKRITQLTEEPKYDEAIQPAKEILAIRIRVQGSDHWETINARWTVKKLQLAAAMSPAEQRELSEADRAGRTCEELYAGGKYDEALPLAKQQVDSYRKLLGDEHPAVAESLNTLAAVLATKGNHAAAEPLLREAVAMRRRLLGDAHPGVALVLGHLAVILHNKGDYAAAEPLYREALAMHRKLLGNEHAAVAENLNNLAVFLTARGDYVAAEPLLREALATRRKLLGNEHVDVAISLDFLASLLREKGDSNAAALLSREAVSILRKRLGDEHPYVAKSLNGLAMLLYSQGDYAAAEPLYREALAMNRKLLGDQHPAVADVLNNLATLLADKGNCAASESLLREALAMQRKLLGDEHPRVATGLNNLAAVLCNKGDYATAEQLVREALAMQRKLLGNEHASVANSMYNLATALWAKGEYAAAEPLFREALAMNRKLLGDEHPRVAMGLGGLAAVLCKKGDYATAEQLAREALAMQRKLLGNEHASVATSMHNLAAAPRAKGEYAAAEPLYREALAMNRKLLGDEHRDVAIALSSLALLLHAKGDYAAAEQLLCEALVSMERLRTGIIGGEAERAAFAGRLQLESVASALCEVRLRLDRADEALEVLERGRSRAFLDLLARQRRDLVEETLARVDEKAAGDLQRRLADEECRRLELSSAEATLAAMEKRRDLDKEEKQKLVDEQAAAIRKARRALADASTHVLAALQDVWPDAKPLSVAQIRAALGFGEVLLTYAWRDDALSALIVTSPAAGPVQGAIVVDGKKKMKNLEAMVAEAKKQISTQPAADVVEAADAVLTKLRAALIDGLSEPMRVQIKNAQRLIVLPDGPLHGIPFDLVLAAGQSVSDAKTIPEVIYADSATLSVNRQREAQSKPKSDKPTALVIGDPIFDRERVEPKYPDGGVLIAQVAEGSNAAAAGLTRGDVILRYDGKATEDLQVLAGLLQAVGKQLESGERKADKKIAVTYWRDGRKHKTKVAPGKLGAALDKGDPKKGLELLAMRSRGEDAAVAEVSMLDQIRLHGGTLSPLPGTLQEAKTVARVIKQAGGGTDSLLGESANLRELESKVEGKRILHIATHGLTGSSERPYDASLALTQPETPSPDDIGFLTLDHLIRKWRGKLKDCDLVVLSACDTQRGVKKGDSVMALPWGFFYAGAPTVVASLWKVDDVSTSILMEEFYRNLLERKMTKAKALQAAKETLRTMSYEEARRRSQMSEEDFERYAKARGWGDEERESEKGKPRATTPYAHPYYWAAFVLIGSPE